MNYFTKHIDKKDILRMERKASRELAIENGVKPYGKKIHKSGADYKRNKKPIHQYLNFEDDF